ncbi:transporter substrate-binding domain-containing protein [Bradyrhizobium acaciae]|uniref:transporter substrate-binding domain-containing protein n=1 Tax=Bradyrhizobium acaciae TaxID=2683706 RepID=UPI001E58A874|nr:transporter substrate-binding domain-containing protein [Bradyrhizobium acaciae]MCC8978570.1 transporter substrate-binding domain-containing protein [Bradyrhizobium acaciae]
MRSNSGFLSFVLFLAFAFHSLPAYARSEDALLLSMREAGEAKAAIAAAPPWAFTSPSGEPQGYLIDITNLALEGLTAPKISVSLTTWDSMIPGLQARRFDLVPAGLLITADRCKVVAFSAPITAQQDALHVLPGNPKHLSGYAQIAQNPDIELAVLTGSAQEAFALKQGISSAQLVRVPDIQAGIATVRGGRAHAFAVGQFSVPHPQRKGVEVVVDKRAPITGMAVAFRKDDAHFRDAFNEQLTLLRSGGAMKDLYVGKYGFPNWDVLAKLVKPGDIVPGCE